MGDVAKPSFATAESGTIARRRARSVDPLVAFTWAMNSLASLNCEPCVNFPPFRGHELFAGPGLLRVGDEVVPGGLSGLLVVLQFSGRRLWSWLLSAWETDFARFAMLQPLPAGADGADDSEPSRSSSLSMFAITSSICDHPHVFGRFMWTPARRSTTTQTQIARDGAKYGYGVVRNA